MSWFPYGDNKKTGVSWKLGILGEGETHCLCVCSVVQSRSTLCDPVDCNPLDSSAYRIFQARILEWVAISSCREFSWPRDRTRVSCIAGGFFTTEPCGNPPAMQEMQEIRVWSPAGGNGNPFQYSCLENPVEREAWWATVHRVPKNWTWLSDWARWAHLTNKSSSNLSRHNPLSCHLLCPGFNIGITKR